MKTPVTTSARPPGATPSELERQLTKALSDGFKPLVDRLTPPARQSNGRFFRQSRRPEDRGFLLPKAEG